MKLKLPIVLVLIAGSLAGCGEVVVFGHTMGEKHPASEVKAESNVTAAATTSGKASPTQISHVQLVKSVTLVLTPQVAAKVTDDPRFNAELLLAAIKTELQSRKLLDVDSTASVTAEISIDDYSMHPTSNVIVFGNITSAGTLNGNIRLRDAQGNNLPNRRVEAQTRVSIPAEGESKNPLAPLYHRFAVMTGNSLAGAADKSSDESDQRPR